MTEQSIKFQTISFFILLVLILAVVSRVFLPYASVLLWSAILYILSSSMYKTAVGTIDPLSVQGRSKRCIIAGLFSVGIVILVAGSLFLFVLKIIGQGQVLAKKMMNFFVLHPDWLVFEKDSPLNEMVMQISLGTIDLSAFNVKKELMTFLAQYTDTIVHYATSLVKNIGNFIMSLIFMCFALYFFYIDGENLALIFVSAIPIRKEESMQLAEKFNDTVMNLFKGYFLVSICQFFAALILFLMFRVEGALVLAFLTFFSSFLPLLGCALVWFPIGIELCFSASIIKGVFFLCTAGIFISSLDNILRPVFLQSRISIHPLLIFFSILGGVQVFGFNGIVLGPLFVILLFTLIDMARTADNTPIVLTEM